MEPSVLHLKAKAGRMTLARVTVTATARLHFGFLDPSGRGTRPFGSFGLSLDRPRTRLSIEPAPAICAGGLGALRAQRYLEAIVESVGLDRGYVVKVEEEITPHAGLGSGTQLALAVGTAFSTLEGLGLSPQEIASRLYLSQKTVRNHASNIYKKLHIFDRTQAVIYAIRRGLVDVEELEPR